MSELVDGGEVSLGGRPAWVGRLRRPLLLIAVTMLCGACYLAGIWSGMKTDFTCVTAKPVSSCAAPVTTLRPCRNPALDAEQEPGSA